MTPDTALAEKMIAFADQQGFELGHEMREAAAAFDSAAKGYFAVPQTCAVKAFFGRWAKARRIWCKYSGEALL